MTSGISDALLESLTDEQCLALLYEWSLWARENQLTPPGDWSTWLVLAGRGFGKTRTGAEFVKEAVNAGKATRIALVGRTAADCRDTMVEGESGLLSVFAPDERPVYEPSKRRITFSNGVIATTYSGDEPSQLRGPQHDLAWCDELAAWKYTDTWDQLQFGLRLGADPRVIVTTTPRPTKIIRELLADPTTFVTRGSTFDNINNLAPTFARKIIKKYEGTRLGRQELFAEILDENPHALWTRELIDAYRVQALPPGVELVRIVVGVDPAVTSNDDSDDTGIVVAGKGDDNHYYVLHDKSRKGKPNEWAGAAIAIYKTTDADRVVGEVNNGGDLIEAVLRVEDPEVSYKSVHASRGKHKRAEPIASLYEQGKVHHVGTFAEMEDQMSTWDPSMIKESPDRMDALVWALTELHDDNEIFIA